MFRRQSCHFPAIFNLNQNTNTLFSMNQSLTSTMTSQESHTLMTILYQKPKKVGPIFLLVLRYPGTGTRSRYPVPGTWCWVRVPGTGYPGFLKNVHLPYIPHIGTPASSRIILRHSISPSTASTNFWTNYGPI